MTAAAQSIFLAITSWLVCCGLSSGQAVATKFTQNGSSGGGELLSASINPYDNNQLYAVCNMMGVYGSSNQGTNWKLLPTTDMVAMSRTKVQFNSGSQQFAIRRIKWGSEACYPYVSSDGGLTWGALPLPANSSSGQAFSSLHVDLASTDLATQRYVLEDYQKVWLTLNGGATYSLIYQHTPTSSSPQSIRVAGAYWDGNAIYVGTNLGLFVSINNGDTWTMETNHSGPPAGSRISQFCGAKNPATNQTSLFAIYVTADTELESWTGNRLDGAAYLGLYRMDYTNNASPWVAKASPNGEAFRLVDVPISDSRYPWAIAGEGGSTMVCRSEDSGNTWTNTIKNWDTGYASNVNLTTGYQGDGGVISYQWGAFHNSINVAGFNPGTVLVTGCFPYMTTDNGNTWKQLYVTPGTQNAANTRVPLTGAYTQTGLNVTTDNWVHWVDASRFFIGSCDIGMQYTNNSGTSWRHDRNPLTPWQSILWSNCYCIVRRTTGSRLYAAVSEVNDMYEPERLSDDQIDGKAGDVIYSDDEGVTWHSLSGPGHHLPSNKFPGPVVWLAVDPSPKRATNIYASVAHSTLGGIYFSNNDGATWIKLKNPPRTNGHPCSIGFTPAQELVATYAGRRNADGTHTKSSGVFLCYNGGSSWADRTAPNMQTFTREITWNPSSNAWFAAVQGAVVSDDPFAPVTDGNGGIYRTTNGGLAWTRIFAKESVQSCTYLTGSTPLLYVTTSNDGLYVCQNPNAAAPTFTKVKAFPFARAKRVFVENYTSIPGSIWVTTQGGGVWRGTP